MPARPLTSSCPPPHPQVMHAYVDAMDFSGLEFDTAIRTFLQVGGDPRPQARGPMLESGGVACALHRRLRAQLERARLNARLTHALC